jgi:hypothetical protein
MKSLKVSVGIMQRSVRVGAFVAGMVKIESSNLIFGGIVEIMLQGKESVRLRSFEEKSLSCSDSYQKREFSTSKLEFELRPNHSEVPFKVKVPEDFPSTTNFRSFSDCAKIKYSLIAIVKCEGKVVAEAKETVKISPCEKESTFKEHRIIPRNCCKNHGPVIVRSTLIKGIFNSDDVFLADVEIDNSHGSLTITSVCHELWKKSNIRDKTHHFEHYAELISRDMITQKIAYGDSLLNNYKFKIVVNLARAPIKIQNASVQGDLFSCSYFLLLTLTLSSYCGNFSVSSQREIIISV